MDVSTYVAVLLRQWVLIAAAVVLGLATALAVALAATPRYTSTTTVLFSPTSEETGQDLAYAGSYVQGRMQTYKELATTPAVLDAVIEELGLRRTPAALADDLSVSTSQIDTLLEVAATSTNARGAATIADEVAAQLIATVDGIEQDHGAEDTRVRGIVVGEASVSSTPSSPDLLVDLLAGLLLGAFVGAAAATVRHAVRGAGQA